MSHELQNRYSSILLAKTRVDITLKDGVIFNNDYEGSPKAGAVKIPVRDTEVGVGDYNTATGITLSAGSTSYLTVNVNKDKAVNEIIDGYEAEAVPDNIILERLESAGYSLARQLDIDGCAELVSGGTAKNEATLTSENIYGKVVDLRTYLSKKNIPKDGRWLIVTPDTYGLLLKCPEFIKASQLGDAVVQTGAVGKIAGFLVFEYNDDTANLSMIAGHPKFATRVREWRVLPKLINLDGDASYVGASAVKGRYTYAHKVLRDYAIVNVFSPTAIAVVGTALTGDDAGKYTLTATATASGTLKYKVVTDGKLNKYGDAATGFSSFTSGTTKVAAASGNVIEIAEFNSDSELIAIGFYGVA